MKASNVKIGEWLEFVDTRDRYGYLKATGIVEANSDHSTNWKYTNQKKVPYITIVCEHLSSSRTAKFGLIRRFRPRDLQKEVDPRGKYNKDCQYKKADDENLYHIVSFDKPSKTLTLYNGKNAKSIIGFCIPEKDFLKQYKEVGNEV